jgi:hypothetical protein
VQDEQSTPTQGVGGPGGASAAKAMTASKSSSTGVSIEKLNRNLHSGSFVAFMNVVRTCTQQTTEADVDVNDDRGIFSCAMSGDQG